MDFYFIASSRPFAHGQITWQLNPLTLNQVAMCPDVPDFTILPFLKQDFIRQSFAYTCC